MNEFNLMRSRSALHSHPALKNIPAQRRRIEEHFEMMGLSRAARKGKVGERDAPPPPWDQTVYWPANGPETAPSSDAMGQNGRKVKVPEFVKIALPSPPEHSKFQVPPSVTKLVIKP